MKHLKLFNLKSEYDSYKESSDFVTPNISFVEEIGVYYNPKINNNMIVTLNISEPGYNFELDGYEINTVFVDNSYYAVKDESDYFTITFDTTGEHVLEIELLNDIIDRNVFNDSSIISVHIPKTVIEISGVNFESCTKLTMDDNDYYYAKNNCIVSRADNKLIAKAGKQENVIIPDGVEYIENNSFRANKNLRSIVIPNSVTYLGDSVFMSCSNLEVCVLNNKVTEIKHDSFHGCTSLTSITLPESLTLIENYAFEGCSSLTSLTIPKGVTSIGEYAFYNCSSLTAITIPESVTYIGWHAFSSCSSLERATINCLNVGS